MQKAVEADGDIHHLAEVLMLYLREIDGLYAICKKQQSYAAIHTRGQELQIYRMYKGSAVMAKHLHGAVAALPGWEESAYWDTACETWRKLQSEVEDRVERHSSQFHVICRGILWEGIPMLVHVYKFDTDKHLKIELILPDYKSVFPVLPLRQVAEALRCHDFLVPSFIMKPSPPYAGHETKFDTICDYLSRAMPRDLYATQCFPLPTIETS